MSTALRISDPSDNCLTYGLTAVGMAGGAGMIAAGTAISAPILIGVGVGVAAWNLVYLGLTIKDDPACRCRCLRGRAAPITRYAPNAPAQPARSARPASVAAATATAPIPSHGLISPHASSGALSPAAASGSPSPAAVLIPIPQ